MYREVKRAGQVQKPGAGLQSEIENSPAYSKCHFKQLFRPVSFKLGYLPQIDQKYVTTGLVRPVVNNNC